MAWMPRPTDVQLRAAYRALDEAGVLIADLTRDDRAAVQDIVAEALYNGWTPSRAAARINQVIGLNKRQQAAVRAHRDARLKAGDTPFKADRSATAYANRMRRARSNLIAQHEMDTMANEAQRQEWAQQQHDGALSRFAVMVFRTHKDERTCPVCAPLNGRRFSLRDTKSVPPLHPNCRCRVELLDEGVVKARTVRTEAGVRRYKLPKGSPIGFTGTQGGMTSAQKSTVTKLVQALAPSEAHHGDCIGADADFHAIVQGKHVDVVLHPPTNPSKRAFSRGAARTNPKLGYMERNQKIVDAADVLIATPKSDSEELRSGTWATIRRARKAGKRVLIVRPDGSVDDNAVRKARDGDGDGMVDDGLPTERPATPKVPGLKVTVPYDVSLIGQRFYLGDEKKTGGVKVRGTPMAYEDLPMTMYHVTTAAGSVRKDGYLRAGGSGGLNGDPDDRIVSLTTDKEVADGLVRDMKLMAHMASILVDADLDHHVTQDMIWEELQYEAEKQGWEFKPFWREGDYPPDGLGYDLHDWMNQFFQQRSTATKGEMRNPVFFRGTDWTAIDEKQIDVVEVSKGSVIQTGAMVTDFDLGSPGGLSEVRVYGDVPVLAPEQKKLFVYNPRGSTTTEMLRLQRATGWAPLPADDVTEKHYKTIWEVDETHGLIVHAVRTGRAGAMHRSLTSAYDHVLGAMAPSGTSFVAYKGVALDPPLRVGDRIVDRAASSVTPDPMVALDFALGRADQGGQFRPLMRHFNPEAMPQVLRVTYPEGTPGVFLESGRFEWVVAPGQYVVRSVSDEGVVDMEWEPLTAEQAAKTYGSESFWMEKSMRRTNRFTYQDGEGLEIIRAKVEKVRRVRDPEYWGAPVGTPITPALRRARQLREAHGGHRTLGVIDAYDSALAEGERLISEKSPSTPDFNPSDGDELIHQSDVGSTLRIRRDLRTQMAFARYGGEPYNMELFISGDGADNSLTISYPHTIEGEPDSGMYVNLAWGGNQPMFYEADDDNDTELMSRVIETAVRLSGDYGLPMPVPSTLQEQSMVNRAHDSTGVSPTPVGWTRNRTRTNEPATSPRHA